MRLLQWDVKQNAICELYGNGLFPPTLVLNTPNAFILTDSVLKVHEIVSFNEFCKIESLINLRSLSDHATGTP